MPVRGLRHRVTADIGGGNDHTPDVTARMVGDGSFGCLVWGLKYRAIQLPGREAEKTYLDGARGRARQGQGRPPNRQFFRMIFSSKVSSASRLVPL